MNNTPILIVLEDHPLVREALMEKLVSHFGDIDFAYSGPDIQAAVMALGTTDVDCVIDLYGRGIQRADVVQFHCAHVQRGADNDFARAAGF